jgi:hypothetical protein
MTVRQNKKRCRQAQAAQSNEKNAKSKQKAGFNELNAFESQANPFLKSKRGSKLALKALPQTCRAVRGRNEATPCNLPCCI